MLFIFSDLVLRVSFLPIVKCDPISDILHVGVGILRVELSRKNTFINGHNGLDLAGRTRSNPKETWRHLPGTINVFLVNLKRSLLKDAL